MIIELYENRIDKNGKRIMGPQVGEITCEEEGKGGEIIFFETCNEFFHVDDRNHPLYNEKIPILDENHKNLLKDLLNEFIPVTTGAGKDVNGIYHMEGKTLYPWQKETLEYIVKYKLPAWFGTICGKLIED